MRKRKVLSLRNLTKIAASKNGTSVINLFKLNKENTHECNYPLATIPWKDLEEGKRLGQGGYGIVHLGEWQGRTVAIKKLILDVLSERITKEFQKGSLSFWRCGESPHIVKLLCICAH